MNVFFFYRLGYVFVCLIIERQVNYFVLRIFQQLKVQYIILVVNILICVLQNYLILKIESIFVNFWLLYFLSWFVDIFSSRVVFAQQLLFFRSYQFLCYLFFRLIIINFIFFYFWNIDINYVNGKIKIFNLDVLIYRII